MSNIYYPNIYNSLEEGDKIYAHIQKSVTPYEVFVKNAIKSIKEKQDIKARWKKIGGELIQLHLTDQRDFYKIVPLYVIELKKYALEPGIFEVIEDNNDFAYDEEGIVIKSRKDKYKSSIEIIKLPYIKNNKKVIHIKMESFEVIKNGGIYELSDDWESIKITPLWLDSDINVKSIEQERELLEYKHKGDRKFIVSGLNPEKPIYVNGEKTKFDIYSGFDEKILREYQTLKWDGNTYILLKDKPNIYNVEVLKEAPNLPFKKFTYLDEAGKEKIFEYNSIESQSDMKFIVDSSKNIFNAVLKYQDIEFSVEKISDYKNDKNLYRIQLEEIEDSSDDIITSSPLEHFFEDGVEIYEGSGRENRNFEILPRTSNSSEFSFILTEKTKKYQKNPPPTFPKEEFLKLRINTYQLEKQLEALNVFINKPLSEHKPLLNLFTPLNEVQWSDFNLTSLDDKEWLVLKDPTRSGCLEQRSFVEKAISTTDFMLLEGPPGSGKTTAILELICQLIKKGKRVLLCGSTHVAIDNVLERLKNEKFLEKIFPVRIGDENRISEQVRELQLDNVVNTTGLDENLVLDAANLVCGTTMGILKHPSFKTNKNDKRDIRIGRKVNVKVREKSIYPEFDYLIIDESSKTTFNEFLIPALFAKRWILVGDVKQLSPYTDREVIESNIKNLNVDDKVLPKELQDVCFILKELCFNRSLKGIKFIISMKQKEIPYLISEVNKRNFNEKKYLIIANNYKNKEHTISEEFVIKSSDEIINEALYINYIYDGIFIEKNLLKELENYLPVEFLLLRSDLNDPLSLLFRQNYEINYFERYSILDRGRKYEGLEIPNELNKTFKERSWSSEIAWKMIRRFELKDLGGKKAENARNLQRDIDLLLPNSQEKVKDSLFILNQVALPSILESLQRGIDKKEKYHSTTTLTEGFTKVKKHKGLNNRFVTLKYQHRMHPEISKIPRELFYSNQALNNADGLERQWSFSRYPSRNVWINHNHEAKYSSNEKEVQIIRRELEYTRHWRLKEKNTTPLTIGILTFYRKQERILRDMLREYCSKYSKKSQNYKMSQFYIEDNQGNNIIEIKLYTVDKFQGQEADIIFLSMVNTRKDGFMDNPNRLNVAITRARYQMIYVGKVSYYKFKSKSDELREIAEKTIEFKG
jgi:superfamily I DNA and/or RNA helicase